MFSVEEGSKDWRIELVLVHMFSLDNSAGECYCLDWSPDSQFVVAGYDDHWLRMFDIYTNRMVKGFDGKGHTESVTSVSFSPDGRFIASGSGDNNLYLWDAATGKAIEGFDGKGHTGHVQSISFSPDGKFIASGSRDKTIRLWNTATGKPTASIDGKGYTNLVRSVSFSPDGRFIASGSWDNTVRLWDAATGKSIEGFDGKGHTRFVESVSFSPDGRFIVSGSADRTLLIWSLKHILGPSWLKKYLAGPLILTGVWFPEATLTYLKQTKQGHIVANLPLARCGECGQFFPVEDSMRGKEIRCPNESKWYKCRRLLKLNEFSAGKER